MLISVMLRRVPTRFFFLLLLACLPGIGGAFAASGEKLEISNLSYEPYAGDLYVRNEWSYEYMSSRTELPAQTANIGGTPVNWPQASIESPKKKIYTELMAKYGIADWLNIGLSGRYMLEQNSATTYQGGLNLGPSTSASGSGFYQPYFSLGFRFAGTEKEDWYLNLELRYQPGLRNNNAGISSPQDTYIALCGLAANSGNWTYGVALYVGYSQPTNYNGVSYTEFDVGGAQGMLQYDFLPFYIRGSIGALKFFDSTSQSNPILKQSQPFLRAELGLLINESTVLNALLDGKLPLSSGINTNGLSGTSYYNGTVTGTISVASTF